MKLAPATVRHNVNVVFEVVMHPRVLPATIAEEIKEVLAREFDRYIDGEIIVHVLPRSAPQQGLNTGGDKR